MEALKTSGDVLFILLGAILVLAMHAGFAFLELGTVRRKNQVNALMKILVDFSVSTIAYFFIGYGIAYGTTFFVGAETLAAKSGYELVKFFFLLTFAAAIPAIVSGGIAERARFNPQVAATFLLVGFLYPFFEGIAWNQAYGIQAAIKGAFGEEFHDFAGSVVVHAVGGWVALAAVLLLGPRMGRYTKDGRVLAFPPSNIPFLALGAWVLSVGWFGFNVMSAQTIDKISGLVAVNSLMAMAGGTIAGLVVGRNDPGFVHNGPLAGLVAICAGSDVMHPLGALVTGGVAGALFVWMFNLTQNRLKVDDVLGVWPLHGLCGTWGGLACGIFGTKALGGMGGVTFASQAAGTALGVAIAFAGGLVIYGLLKATSGIRLDAEEEFQGADLSIHNISSTPEREERAWSIHNDGVKGDDDITGMLARAREGDAAARDGAVAALYRELSRLARSKLNAESTITNLDATALVHECYIRLAEGAPGQWENRHAFFNYAAAAMRNVIVDVAREHNAQKRGGGLREVTLTTGVAAEVFAPDEIEHLEAALLALGKVDAQLLQIVELRYFAGLTIEDVAQQLDLSPRTVKRRWESARAFLFKKLRG